MRPRYSTFSKCIVDGKLRFHLSALDISGSWSSDVYLYVYNCAGEKQHLVVKPRDGAFQEGWGSVRFLDNVAHLPRTSEEKLVLAVLGGHIDATKLSLPASMS